MYMYMYNILILIVFLIAYIICHMKIIFLFLSYFIKIYILQDFYGAIFY